MPSLTITNRVWITIPTNLPAEQLQQQQWQQEEFSMSDPSEESWLSRIRKEVYKHSEVEDLYISIGEVLVDYWIIIPRRDIILVRSLIEDQHQKIINLFAKTDHPPFQLDFHICYRQGRNARELVPTDSIQVPKF